LASPKEKIPPSEPRSQYPPPVGVAAIPVMAAESTWPAIEPFDTASPKFRTRPSAVAVQ
jgi:hypothetical protein